MRDESSSRRLIAAIQAWAAARDRGWRSSGPPEALSLLQLHTRPDPQGPEVQITFRPDIVDGRAVLRVDFGPPQQEAPIAKAEAVTRASVALPTAGGRDPDAPCDACGAVGTIGRASRTDPTGAIVESYRFCIACWPEQSARYKARWDEQARVRRDQFLRHREPARGAGPGTSFEAATWHMALKTVREIQRTMVAQIAPSKAELATIASRLEENAALLEGEMPFEIEMFIHRYRAAEGA